MEGAARTRGAVHGAFQRGASIVEAVIALPILLVVILGAIQFGLIYEAKATLNHAALQAARLGAVRHADPSAIRRGLARGLAPLHSPEASLDGVGRTIRRLDQSLVTDARILILNPTREAFSDFATEVDGEREIPNDRLHTRSTALGAQSGINIQDANLLKVQVTYGYELRVPLVNWFIARALLGVRRGADVFERELLRRTRIPIIATATVRMQTPARLSDAVVARSDLPDLDRIPVNAPPPESADSENQREQDASADNSTGYEEGDDAGSRLDEGFFGFGEGSAGGGGGRGGSTESGSGGGLNGGNPSACSISRDNDWPFPIGDGPPGDSSPVPPPGVPGWFGGAGSDASIDSISLAAMSVGNPVHVATGNKYQAETDIEPLPGMLGIGFVRHYNSAAVSDGSVMGAGWRHGYQSTLRPRGDTSIEVLQGDGRLLVFRRSNDARRFEALRASDGSIAVRDGVFVWRWPSGRELYFAPHGQLTRIVDRAHALSLRYNDSNELESVTDSYGRELHFDYYPNGRLRSVRGPARMGVRYVYDGHGNLLQAIGTDGIARRYLYEDARHPHHLTGIALGRVHPATFGARNEFERIASWSYDELGRAVLSSHPDDAGKVTLRFREHHTDVTDAFGRTTRYMIHWRDGVAYVHEVRGPGCGACARGDARYTYDDRFRPLEIESKGVPSHRYSYDAHGRLQEVQRVIDREAKWIAKYLYEDGASRLARIERPSVNPAGVASLELKYERGRLRELIESGYSPEPSDARPTYRPIQRRTQFIYDAFDRPVRIDGPRKDADDWTRIEYDSSGYVAAVSTPAGARRVLARDAAGRPARIAMTGGPEIRLQYDTRGRIVSVGQVRSRGERVVAYRYDAAGRIVDISDSIGKRQRYGFDAAGRRNRYSDSDTDVIAAIRYAPDDRIDRIAAVTRSGELLRTLYYAYDADRRLIEIRDGEGQPLRQFAYTTADAGPDRKIDAMGGVTSLSYDPAGHLASVLAPDGGLTRFHRDEDGRPTSIIAPNDATTSFVYDDFGRRVEERSADRGVTRYRYDDAGNTVEKLDARGAATRLKYDDANRLVSVARAEGMTTLRYADGLLTNVDGEFENESYEYDGDGQLIAHTRTIGRQSFRTRFGYDAFGRLQTRDLPSGARLRYRYGPTGALESITQERWFGDRRIVEAGDAQSPRAPGSTRLRALGTVTFGNGLTMRTSFDAKTANVTRRAVERVSTLDYGYDDAGRITSIERDGDSRRYEYDALGRLTSAVTAEGEFEYAYDTNGNRVAAAYALPSAEVTRKETTYAYAPRSNRLMQTNGSADGSAVYAYDAAGNPVRIGSRRYEYDTSGRVTKLFEGGRLLAEYRYNFWGERVQKIVHAPGKRESTTFVYEQRRLIAEVDARGNVTREYIYVEHHPVAMIERGALYWIHTDHLGTPIAVTNPKQVVVWRADHHPFGRALIDHDPDGDGRRLTLNLRFPGQYSDAESGTSYNYFREYEPETGRYLSPDPLGSLAGTNAFAYAVNQPLNAYDPMGLYQEDVHYYMTLFLAITAGVEPQAARQIALAAAFVDVNETTRPTNPQDLLTTVASGFENQPQLFLYHFVLADPENGQTLPLYRNGNYYLVANNLSPQLTRMLGYATSAPRYRAGVAGQCDDQAAQLQFFGEFLHAFADTYAHRGRNDRPYDATTLEYGLGHGLGWHWPDHTFNEDSWITREARTFAMELDLRDKLRQSVWAELGRSTTAAQQDQLFAILQDFNRIVESEQHFESRGSSTNASISESWLVSQKVARLNQGLRELGYESIDLTSEEFRFDENEARRQRIEAFRDLDPLHYRHAILDTR